MKKLSLWLTLLAFCHISLAQDENSPDDYYNQMSHVFKYVDRSQVPSGYLLDWGIPMATLQNFSGGSTVNPVDLHTYRAIYTTLFSALFSNHAQAMEHPEVFNDKYMERFNTTSKVPLSIIYFNYDIIDSNAVLDGLFSIYNGQLYDVIGRSRSPYITKQVFTANASL